MKLQKEALRDKKINTTNIEITQQDDTSPKQEPIAYLLSHFHGSVSPKTPLLEIHKNLFKNMEEDQKRKLKAKLTTLVNSIFSIKPGPTVEQEARLEISKLKDRCIKAIRKQETGELEKALTLYTDLAKQFSKYMQLYGGGFLREQAEQERTSFSGMLKPIDWLSRDIREVFEKGMESDDLNIVKKIAYLPLSLAKQAIEDKDHLIFQEFIFYPKLLYFHAGNKQKARREKITAFMFDRSWRYLKELLDYSLEPKLRNGHLNKDQFYDFTVYILKVFQDLLKSSFDNKDQEDFNVFISKLSTLFRNLINSYNYFERDERNELFNSLNEKQRQIFFGLASWILFQLSTVKTNTKKLLMFWRIIKRKLPTNIEEITELFINVQNYDVSDFWEWDRWELKETSDGFVQSINTLEKLEKTYVVLVLDSLRSQTPEEISSIKLPINRDLAFSTEDNTELSKIIKDISTNPKSWDYILPDNAIEKITEFKNLLTKAKRVLKENDLEIKRNAPLSQEKIKNFKKGVVKNFYDTSKIRDLLKQHGLFLDESNIKYKGKIEKRGINILFDKTPFLDNTIFPHIHFIGLENGFTIGQSIYKRIPQ